MTGNSEDEQYYYKIVLIGDGRVGKTSLRRDFMGETFEADYHKTLLADFASHSLDMDGYKVTYSIWDLAGQPEMEDVRTKYYYGAFGAILVFDITNPSSYHNLDNWIDQLKKSTMSNGVPLIIAANKMDLQETEETVDFKDVTEYIEQLRDKYEYDVHFIKTSAKTGQNVEEAFRLLADTIHEWKN